MNPSKKLITESRNPASMEIDQVSTLEMLKIINNEDQKVALAVQEVLPHIADAVDLIAQAFLRNGRLIYFGAGTSGRLGVLDASECPPTFGTLPNQVLAFIAGGTDAMFHAVENAEDNPELAIKTLQDIDLTPKDILIGIAASGHTPYVLAAMQYAKKIQAKTVSISCNPSSPMSSIADIAITPIVGPEILTGSSRMKAGTAQKMILNMLTTGAMIRTGKVLGNLMVDVQANNEKLRQRQVRIVMEATNVSQKEAEDALKLANNHCKTAILMLLTGLNAEEATARLLKNNGFIRSAVAN